MKRPRVSVLLPVRDGGTTLAASLRSVGRQTLRDWECVVVDDGSRDDSAAIAGALAAREPRVRLLRQEPLGLVHALRTGLAACRGRYVARHDADDLMHRARLEEQASLLDARPDLAACGCHVRLFPRARLGDGTREYERWLNEQRDERTVRRDVFIECPVAHPSLLARRDVLVRVTYRDVGWPEDYDLVLRLVLGGDAVGVLPRRRVLWRDHGGRLSRTSPVYAVERFTACKAAHLARTFLARRATYLLWGYGATGRALRRELARHGPRPSHVIEVHPRRLGNRIHGAPVVGPDDPVSLEREPLVVSVAGRGPRRLIRRFLLDRGWRETVDFVCAA